MSRKSSFARTTAAVLIVLLFAFSLPVEAVRVPKSMSEKEVHDTITTLGVGHSVALRISTDAGGGAVQFSQVSGHIDSISSDSVVLSTKHGHTISVQTYAYKNIDRVDDVPLGSKREVIGLLLIGGVATALLVKVLHRSPPAPEIGASN